MTKLLYFCPPLGTYCKNMNMFEEYRAYLADNPEGYWFKRKLYGYGWTPARWQGWVLTGVYLVFIFGVLFVSSIPQKFINPEEMVIPIIGATILFVAITWKTGEPPKWQWGKTKENRRRD